MAVLKRTEPKPVAPYVPMEKTPALANWDRVKVPPPGWQLLAEFPWQPWPEGDIERRYCEVNGVKCRYWRKKK